MNGILLIDKQPDWTSNDVVAKLKGILPVSYTHLTLPTICSV